jgi:glutathione peroxidase
MNYGVDFPLLEKQKVLGGDRSPLYQYLLKGRTPVLWNFEKVLVGRDGKVIDRFRSVTAPDDEKFIKAIEAALN